MTELEYNNLLNEIEVRFKKERNQLHFTYAASQRKFKIGDIIKNDTSIIKIERFGIFMFTNPKPTYIGAALKKDLTPKKNGSVETIFHSEDIELVKASSL